MSPIANLSSAPRALPAPNIPAHGHKKGQHAQPIDDSGSGGAAQTSAGATQSLFGRLLHSLEKVIGAQLGMAASAAASAAASTGASATTAAAAGSDGGSKLSGAGISLKA
jgi:hypothetical protein